MTMHRPKYTIKPMGMIKWSMLLVLTILGMLAFLGQIQRAAAVNLKAEALITGDNITVGDVFDGVKTNSDYVLAPAPSPGKELVWNARTLYRIAHAFDLPWHPENGMTQLRIRRLATLISHDEIKTRIKEELRPRGLSPDTYDISLEGLPQEGLILPYGSDESFAINSVSYDAGRKMVRAVLRSPAEGPTVKTASLHGYVVDVETVPVLKERMRRGDIIKASDIKYIKVPSDSLAHDVVLKPEDVIGSTPRMSINSTSPIRSFDLELPTIVERGKAVTMIYKKGRIHIETTGKALQDGSKGDLIRILNGSSGKTIQAVVTGEREVSVQ